MAGKTIPFDGGVIRDLRGGVGGCFVLFCDVDRGGRVEEDVMVDKWLETHFSPGTAVQVAGEEVHARECSGQRAHNFRLEQMSVAEAVERGILFPSSNK